MKSLVYVCLASLFVSLVAFGQTTPPNGFGTTSLSADLSPLNLVPPLEDRAESGAADIEITLAPGSTTSGPSGVVSFDITLETALSDGFTGFAIHQGASGLNGPVVVETQFVSDPEAEPGNTISGQITVNSQTQLEGLQAVVQNPEGYYVVVAGVEHPAGLLRGQLQSGDDMGEEVDNLSEKLDRMQEQLNVMQRMIRSIGGVLGIDPAFLPEPEDDASDGTGDTSTP
jgi:hypothetical protein